jgi:hypothetical protein
MNGTVLTCNGFVLRREPLPRVLLIMLANGTTVLKGLCEQTQYYDMSCQARARAWACPSSVRRLQEQGLLRRRCRPGHFQLPVSGQNAADNSDASDHLFAIELDASISASSLLRLQRWQGRPLVLKHGTCVGGVEYDARPGAQSDHARRPADFVLIFQSSFR